MGGGGSPPLNTPLPPFFGDFWPLPLYISSVLRVTNLLSFSLCGLGLIGKNLGLATPLDLTFVYTEIRCITLLPWVVSYKST